jgi:hypothetical protein
MEENLSCRKTYPMAIAILLLALVLPNTSFALPDLQVVPPGYMSDIPSTVEAKTLPTYDLSISFSPSSFSLARGHEYTVTIYITNNGASAFVATGCKGTITWSTGKTVKVKCVWGSQFSFQPYTEYSGTWSFTAGSNPKKTPLGSSTWTMVITGKVNGKKMQSDLGVATITITP